MNKLPSVKFYKAYDYEVAVFFTNAGKLHHAFFVKAGEPIAMLEHPLALFLLVIREPESTKEAFLTVLEATQPHSERCRCKEDISEFIEQLELAKPLGVDGPTNILR